MVCGKPVLYRCYLGMWGPGTTDLMQEEGRGWILGSHICLQNEVQTFLSAVHSSQCLTSACLSGHIPHLLRSLQLPHWNVFTYLLLFPSRFVSRANSNKCPYTYTVNPHYLRTPYLQIQLIKMYLQPQKPHLQCFLVIRGTRVRRVEKMLVIQHAHCPLRSNEATFCLLVSALIM